MRDPSEDITYQAQILLKMCVLGELFEKTIKVEFDVPSGFVIGNFELENMAKKIFLEEYQELVDEFSAEYNVINVRII